MLRYHTPPGAGTPPQADPPPEQTPLQSRHPPGVDPQDWTPQSRHLSPPPAAEHAGRYGQRAGSTHPTGMQSCCVFVSRFDGDNYLKLKPILKQTLSPLPGLDPGFPRGCQPPKGNENGRNLSREREVSKMFLCRSATGFQFKILVCKQSKE